MTADCTGDSDDQIRRPFQTGETVTLKGSDFYYDAAVRVVARVRAEEQRARVLELQSRGRVLIELPDGSQRRIHEKHLRAARQSDQ